MLKPLLAILPLSLLSAGVEARELSTDAELRGFNACVDAVNEDGFVPARYYYLDKQADTPRYFINATRWEDGERAKVRVICETTSRGASVLAAAVEPGRFTNDRGSVRIEVANR